MSRLLLSHCFQKVMNTSFIIDNGRTPDFIIMKLTEEIGELSAEMIIRDYDTYKDEGKDGVLGEAIDTFIALADLSYIYGMNQSVHDHLFTQFIYHEQTGQKETFYRLISSHANIVNHHIDDNEVVTHLDFSRAIFDIFDIILMVAENENQIISIIDNKLGKWGKTYINA